MADQLEHILQLPDMENIDIRVVTFASGWHPALEGLFVLIESDQAPPAVPLLRPGGSSAEVLVKAVSTLCRHSNKVRTGHGPPGVGAVVSGLDRHSTPNHSRASVHPARLTRFLGLCLAFQSVGARREVAAFGCARGSAGRFAVRVCCGDVITEEFLQVGSGGEKAVVASYALVRR